MIVVFTASSVGTEDVGPTEALFDEGLDLLHFRKHGWTLEAARLWLERLDPRRHAQVVLHTHVELAHQFDVYGVHLRESSRNGKGQVGIPDRCCSRSFHHPRELYSETPPAPSKRVYSHVFLSPVFTSISKPEYGPSFDLDEVREAARCSPERLVALGGIDETSVAKLAGTGVRGIALLGAVWKSRDPREAFKRVRSKWPFERAVERTVERDGGAR